MQSLFSLLFGLRAPVNRKLYLQVGLALAALKYVGDAAIVYATSGVFWSPLRYALMSWSLSIPKMESASVVFRDVSDVLLGRHNAILAASCCR